MYSNLILLFLVNRTFATFPRYATTHEQPPLKTYTKSVYCVSNLVVPVATQLILNKLTSNNMFTNSCLNGLATTLLVVFVNLLVSFRNLNIHLRLSNSIKIYAWRVLPEVVRQRTKRSFRITRMQLNTCYHIMPNFPKYSNLIPGPNSPIFSRPTPNPTLFVWTSTLSPRTRKAPGFSNPNFCPCSKTQALPNE